MGSQCLSKKKKKKHLALSEEEDEMYSKVTPFNRPIRQGKMFLNIVLL